MDFRITRQIRAIEATSGTKLLPRLKIKPSASDSAPSVRLFARRT